MTVINQLFFDIGGVLGSNGWDREQRAEAVAYFGLDAEDFQYRHEETVGAFESGQISLDEYLDVTVFWQQREFSRDEFKKFMFSLSKPWPESLDVVRWLRQNIRGRPTRVRMATLNNESRELNEYRIRLFGLCELFDVFFSSCWLGVRKPTRQIYERVLGMTQAAPQHSVFVDDREQNLAPARALGMKTILYTSADELASALSELGFDLSSSATRRMTNKPGLE
jgi:putative hydrolase of the HAD superfamily